MKFVARHGSDELAVEVERHGFGYRVKLGDRWMAVDLLQANRFLRSLRMEGGEQFLLIDHRTKGKHEVAFGDRTMLVELFDPLALKARREDASGGSGTINALMPGRIVRIHVSEGDPVKKGQGLVVLEAMKMENEIVAPCDGTIARLHVSQGQTVETSAPLVTVIE